MLPAALFLCLLTGAARGQDRVVVLAETSLVRWRGAGAAPDRGRPDAPAPRVGVVGSTLGARFTAEPQPRELSPADVVPPVPAAPAPASTWRVTAVGVASGAAVFGGVDHQRRKWWPERRPRFRIENDWEYSRWADKAGHFVASAFLTRSYRATLRWSGLSDGPARAWAAGAAWTSMLYYEVLDGFGPHWGFSPGDLLFNTMGVAFATGQDVWPALRAFEVRVGYWPSGWSGKAVVDDYAGQTYWLSANPHRLAPAGVRRWLPPWLGVAVGYGARDPDELNMLQTSVVLVGLDVDLAGIPIGHPAWRAFTGVVRYLRVPAPAVRVVPEVRFVPFAF